MAAIIRLNNFLNFRNAVLTLKHNNKRLISTSPKNRETITASPTITAQSTTETKTAANKNWVSYGFDRRDHASDRSSTKASFFFSVTLCLVWGTFIWSYVPDLHSRDWAQREGFLQLRRREMAGLEPISKDYIEPNLMVLPSDDELGDTEIII